MKFPKDNWITQDELKQLESLLPPRPPENMRSDDSVADTVEEVRTHILCCGHYRVVVEDWHSPKAFLTPNPQLCMCIHSYMYL